MGNNYKLDGFKDNKYILKEDLVDYIKKTTNYEKKSSIRWVIHELVKSGDITKIDSEHFYNGVLKEFFPKNESKPLFKPLSFAPLITFAVIAQTGVCFKSIFFS